MISEKAIQPFLSWFGSLGQGFSFGTEALLGLFAVVFIVVWGLSLGRTKSVISLLSIYVAFAIAAVFPFYDFFVSQWGIAEYWLQIIVLCCAIAFVFFVFSISFLRKRLSSGEYSLVGVFMITALQIGLLIAAVTSFMPDEVVVGYLGRIGLLFTESRLFFWFIAPLAGLFFLNYFLENS